MYSGGEALVFGCPIFGTVAADYWPFFVILHYRPVFSLGFLISLKSILILLLNGLLLPTFVDLITTFCLSFAV